MRIRRMHKADIPAIVAQEKEIFPTDPWGEIAFEESLEVEEGGGLIAEEAPDEQAAVKSSTKSSSEPVIAGYACFYSAAEETHITDIAVCGAYRRKGVANLLLEAIFAKARHAKSDAVFLEVRASNTGAQRLYEKNGFKVLYHRRKYYTSPVEDAVVFIKEF